MDSARSDQKGANDAKVVAESDQKGANDATVVAESDQKGANDATVVAESDQKGANDAKVVAESDQKGASDAKVVAESDLKREPVIQLEKEFETCSDDEDSQIEIASGSEDDEFFDAQEEFETCSEDEDDNEEDDEEEEEEKNEETQDQEIHDRSVPVEMTRFLSQEDFEKIRKLRQEQEAAGQTHLSKRSRDAASKDSSKSTTDHDSAVTQSAILGPQKKRKMSKEERVACIMEGRKDRPKFGTRKKGKDRASVSNKARVVIAIEFHRLYFSSPV
jgi:protein SDA1